MKKVIILSCVIVLIAFLSCGKGGVSVNHLEHLGDTPYQTDSILVVCAYNPHRALTMLDSAVMLGNVSEFREQFIRANIFSKSLEEQHQDSALTICKSLLHHDSVKNSPDQKEDILNLLIAINRSKADDNEYLYWAAQKAALCREQGEEVELLRTEAEIGLVMTHLGQTELGLEKIDNSIQQLDKPGSIDRMDAFIIAAKRKISVLNEMGHYQEAIELAQRILDRLLHYEQHSKEYAEDSYRLSWSDNPSNREDYVDFCRAQAHGFMAIAYANLKDVTKAREHIKAFDQSNYGKTFSARRMIVPAQMALGWYDEAMNTSGKMVQNMGADTMNTNYATILYNLAVVAQASGHKDEAFDLMKRHATLSKTLSDSLFKSKANDYAARYHAQEQQLKIQEAENENQQKTIITIAIALLLVITTIASFYFLRQHQRIAKKNHALVMMISKVQDLTTAGHYHPATDDASADDTDEDDAVSEDEEELFTENDSDQKDSAEESFSPIDAQEFAFIDATIRNEHLYSNANLQRQDVCERFGISRVALNNMLFVHRGNASLPQYINSIRIDEAVKLLHNRPDMSISAIAVAVGFSPANFRKQFIRSYGMTPMEFRQNQ
ncbi:MAG: helix-turn-helix domain-containing protein [Prevotella sp.]|nr:helix-turn-helix domain-containing protein [Prevotella sp.]